MTDRIELAKLTLANYVMDRGFAGDLGEDITDLITDMLHLAALVKTGDTPETIHRLAMVHYKSEEVR